jgi:hypothetical protein
MQQNISMIHGPMNINFDTLLHLVGLFFTNCTMMHGSTNIKLLNNEFINRIEEEIILA